MYLYKKGREWKKWKEIFRLPNLYIWTKAYCSRKQSVKILSNWNASTTQKDDGKTHTQRKKQIIKQQNEKYEIKETTTPSLHKSRRSRKRYSYQWDITNKDNKYPGSIGCLK